MRCISPRVSPCGTAAATEFLCMLARGHGGRVSVLSETLNEKVEVGANNKEMAISGVFGSIFPLKTAQNRAGGPKK
eukprot:3184983-Prymnesium_polylepis.1